MKFYKSDLFKGFAAANLFAFLLIGILKYTALQGSNTLIFSIFVIIPLMMGIIASWFWRNLDFKSRTLLGNSILNGALAILFSAVFLREGVICLIIVSPLILTFIITGAFLGHRMFKKNNQKLNVSIISLLFVVFIADSLSSHDHVNMVSDEIIVKASPEKIWKNVVAFEKIKQKDQFWLFRVGMPSPMQTTVEGYHQGAGRKCIFSNGYTFDEKIVTYKPNEDLTFRITGQPLDPEIMGHIDIQQGQFLLKDNGNGTTTLTGNSWYKLHVFPLWYYDLWAESITRNVHLRVMEHIKQLSENK
ncbi:SRPBCC family protein [Pedobacter nutrimenti]|jgi:hypothetical protein|uniref:Polyketide cyclase/dehydrase/lipid transport protein n=1 Tax=Pedobacter nutrimenti TaxID=1241337 RepID=A0A318UIK2_9SPHI|nr:hypothetical protein [Pedobacter nutrimenti]PYF74888.1 hypothetical protein B0O44_103334 [Pedobacter nutrimenti]